VNGGVTVFSKLGQQTWCIVWRKEEGVKVIIHEYLHARLIEKHAIFDRCLTGNALCRWGWAVSQDIIETVKFSETAVELLAEAIIQEDLERLRSWSLWQMAKLLYVQGLTFDIFFGNTPSTRRFKQSANLLEYYILKAILLWSDEIGAMWERPSDLLSCLLQPDRINSLLIQVIRSAKWRKATAIMWSKVEEGRDSCMRMTPPR
jgi:hypothetical protein